MINRVTLIGYLGTKPEIRHLDNGGVLAKFRLATHESYKDSKTGEWRKNTEWHNIVMWRELAQRAEKQLHEGHLIYLEGKIGYRTWEHNGETRSIAEITVETFRLLDRREPSATAAPENPASGEQPAPPQSNLLQRTELSGEDDLPF